MSQSFEGIESLYIKYLVHYPWGGGLVGPEPGGGGGAVGTGGGGGLAVGLGPGAKKRKKLY